MTTDQLEATRAGLARRIKQLRTNRGLTVRALAERTELTPAMISQVESASVTPSVATLVRLAGVFGISIGELFNTPAPTGTVVRLSERKVVEYPTLGVTDESISADPTGKLQVLQSTIGPGAVSGDPFVHGSEAECVIVIEGSVDIALGSQTVHLDVGDTVSFSGDVPHGFSNPSDQPARLIWIITPASY